MSESKINPRAIFNAKNLIRYFWSLIGFFLAFSFILIYTTSQLYKNVITDYKEKLVTIDKTEGLDINLMCNVISCKSVIYIHKDKEYYYQNKNGILRPIKYKPSMDIKYFSILNNDLATVINYKNLSFLVDDSNYMYMVNRLFLTTMSLFALFFTLAYFLKLLNEHRTNLLEKGSYKLQLEGKLQRDITESLHHEMGAPLALIDTLVKDLYATLYPCKHTMDNICDFRNEVVSIEQCVGCKFKDGRHGRKIDEIAKGHYYKIFFGLERLNSVLKLIAGSKHIKYSNGNIAIYDILDNIISSNNSFRVNKVEAVYLGLPVFKKYACGPGLTNGELLLVLHAMIINAIEAKATCVEFEPTVNRQTMMMKIHLRDNGRGIRDKFDNIVTDESIFNYGFSTKTDKGDQILVSGIKKVISYIGLGQHGNNQRGVGLSVNKRILMRSGGNIELEKTTVNGTDFVVTIPIKERRDAH